jgi:thiol-disulfide isomerase/thioredoxin
MKCWFIGIACLILGNTAFAAHQDAPDAKAVLIKLSDKLHHLGKISYHYRRTLSYPSEKYQAETSANIFLDYTVTDTVLGFHYQVNNESIGNVYNGSEQFELDKKGKTIVIHRQPAFQAFRFFSFFSNSIATLQKVLPEIISDASIEKSITDTASYYQLTLTLDKRTLNYLGGISTLTREGKIFYKILIDKKTSLPRQILQTNSVNTDQAQTDFTDIAENGVVPTESSWYYSTYLPAYSIKENKTPIPIAINAMAPNWQLPRFGRPDSLSLQQLKGNIVLLEFWIKNCSHCIEAVPALNAIKAAYKNKPLKIIAINAYDKALDIAAFREVTHPDYEIAYNGAQTAAEYGIPGYPMVVLIDRQGKVIYSAPFDQAKITALLKEVL